MGTLENLFCRRNFDTKADWQSWVADFDALIADPSPLTASELSYLDTEGNNPRVTGDGVLDEEDRDYWLDRMLWSAYQPDEGDRLPAGIDTANPANYADSDPLGLAGSRPNVIFIDNTNSSRVVIATGNNCTLPGGGSATPSLLWDDTSDTTYNHKVWAEITDIDETGSASTRRCPRSTDPVTIYIRGGNYTASSSIVMNRNGGSSDSSKIIIRAYPGERPVLNAGIGTADTYLFQIQRPDVHLGDGLVIYGYLGAAGSRTFCPDVIRFAATTAPRGQVRHITIYDHLGIISTHPQAGSLPHLVDAAWTSRGGTNKSGTGFSIKINADGCEVRTQTLLRMRPNDFPFETSLTTFAGECIDINTVDGCKIIDTTLTGGSQHGQIRLIAATNVTIDGCDISNIAHTCILISANCNNYLVRRNRIHDWGQLLDDAANGIQAQSASNGQITKNVIWNDGREAPGFGIRVCGDADDGAECNDNEVDNNVVYNAGVAIAHNGGWPNIGSELVHDNETHHNVIVGMPVYNATQAVYNAPLHTNFGQDADSNNAFGNTEHDNLLARLDGGLVTMTNLGLGGAVTTYGIGDTYPGYTGNITGLPLFTDPASGDFTLLGGSAVTWLADDVPLAEFDDVWGVWPYVCTPIGSSTGYGRAGSQGTPLNRTANATGTASRTPVSTGSYSKP